MIEATDIYYFYQIVDPRDNLPFYVGQTISPDERLKSYLNGRPHYHSRALTQRLRELEQAGLQPIMQVLERKECTWAEALQREVYWIRNLTNQGITLLNRNNNKEDRKQQTVYMPKELAKRLKIHAAMNAEDISVIITKLVEAYLDEVEPVE